MNKNKKLKQTKDSILIRKNGKYPEDVNEVARQRSIYMLLAECGLLITYLIFLIVYAVGDKFKLLILILQIAIVSFQIISICFSIHSLIFFKEYIIAKSSNLSILLYCLMIVPFVFMYLEVDSFTIQIIIQITLIIVQVIICGMDQYLIRTFLLDFLKQKQRYNLKDGQYLCKLALLNKKSFEECLSKSIASKSDDFI